MNLMKRAFLILMVVAIGMGTSQAQDENSDDQMTDRKEKKRRNRGEVKTLSGRNYHSGGFGAISFKGTRYQDQTLMMAGFRGGWIINRTVALGFEGWGFIPSARLDNVYQFDDVVVLGGYGGFFIEPILFSNEIVHLTFPVSGGAGWMGYDSDFLDPSGNGSYGESYLVDDDVFWYIEPGAAIEFNISRGFRIDLGASYRFTEDLNLINTSESAFDDWNYFLTLKFGGF